MYRICTAVRTQIGQSLAYRVLRGWSGHHVPWEASEPLLHVLTPCCVQVPPCLLRKPEDEGVPGTIWSNPLDFLNRKLRSKKRD